MFDCICSWQLHRQVVAAVLWCSLALVSESADKLKSLDPIAWSNRIIVVNEPEELDDVFDAFDAAADAIKDRDIFWFVLTDAQTHTNYNGELAPGFAEHVRARLFSDAEAGQIVLIGKDSDVKDRSDALDLDRLFALIDSMPMRRAEMRSNEGR